MGEYIPTQAYDLNRILSGSLYNGVVAKTNTFIVGPEASGKSSFMCLNFAAAQKMGYFPVIFDTEGAWTDEFCQRWGIDIENAAIFSNLWIEDIMTEMTVMIKEDWRKMALVIDSVGGLESYKMITDGAGDRVGTKRGGVKVYQGDDP